MAYATREEVFALGLDAQAFAPRSREIEEVDPSTGTILLSSHNLFDGALLRFMVKGSPTPGAPSAALPAGLSAFTMYEVTTVSGSSDLFRVAPVSGSLITSFGDAGAGVFSLVVDPGPNIDRIAENESANIDESATGHAVPFEREINGRYAEILVGVCARRTAIRSALRLGLANPVYQASLDALVAGQMDDAERLKTWLAGKPINVRPTDQTPTVPDNAARAGYDMAPEPWRTGLL